MDKATRQAAKALGRLDRARSAVKQAELEVRDACRAYGEANRLWGLGETALRRALRMKEIS